MTRFLAIISLVLLGLGLYSTSTFADNIQSYNLYLVARGNEITGICVMEHRDGKTQGTIVSEFGMKILDFAFNGKKAKVKNVFDPLNKWYIRKVLNGDLTFLLKNLYKKENMTKGSRTLMFGDKDDFELTNTKYKLKYCFSKMEGGIEDDADK